MSDVFFRSASVLLVGFTLYGRLGAAQQPVDARGSSGPLACRAAPGRVGTDAWLRGLTGILTPTKQDELRPGRLHGYVLDPAGKPLERVGVILTPGWDPPGDTTKRRTVLTSPTGEFVLDSISDESYILTIRKAGRDSQWRAYRGLRGISDTLCIEMRITPYALGRSSQRM